MFNNWSSINIGFTPPDLARFYKHLTEVQVLIKPTQIGESQHLSRSLLKVGEAKWYVRRATPQDDVGEVSAGCGVEAEKVFASYGYGPYLSERRVSVGGVGGKSHASAEINRDRASGKFGIEVGAKLEELHAFRVGAKLGRSFRAGGVLFCERATFRNRERALRLGRIHDNLDFFFTGGEKGNRSKGEQGNHKCIEFHN